MLSNKPRTGLWKVFFVSKTMLLLLSLLSEQLKVDARPYAAIIWQLLMNFVAD